MSGVDVNNGSIQSSAEKLLDITPGIHNIISQSLETGEATSSVDALLAQLDLLDNILDEVSSLAQAESISAESTLHDQSSNVTPDSTSILQYQSEKQELQWLALQQHAVHIVQQRNKVPSQSTEMSSNH